MIKIEIPRDPSTTSKNSGTVSLRLSAPERALIERVAGDLRTLPQTAVAVLHEGYRQWDLVNDVLGAPLVALADGDQRAATVVKALDPQAVSHVYGQFAARQDTPAEPLVVTYITNVAPEPLGLSVVEIEAALRHEVGLSCVVAMTAYALELRKNPAGVLVGERGFVPVPWPFVPRYFNDHLDDECDRLFDSGLLDNPDAFRFGLEF